MRFFAILFGKKPYEIPFLLRKTYKKFYFFKSLFLTFFISGYLSDRRKTRIQKAGGIQYRPLFECFIRFKFEMLYSILNRYSALFGQFFFRAPQTRSPSVCNGTFICLFLPRALLPEYKHTNSSFIVCFSSLSFRERSSASCPRREVR